MIFKGLISLLLATILSSCGVKITDETLFSASISEGNHVHFGPLGVSIQVEKPIQITSVGAFEGNSEAEFNVKVAIFDNFNKQLVPSSEIYEINKDNSKIEKNYRFRKINPISISPGSYMLVAQGYNGRQKFGNTGISGKGPAANKNELVSIGSCFFGNGGISYPDTKDYHIYHAGNIKFRPLAESVETRLSQLEAEIKKLKEANAEIIIKNERPAPPVMRRRELVPISQTSGVQDPEPNVFLEEFAGHTYQFIPEKKTWNSARKIAQQKNGYLVSITSEDENKFITSLIQKACAKRNEKNPHVWIGLSNDNDENKWTWESGEKYEFSSWCNGEPNNWGGFETAVQFNKNANNDLEGIGRWNDMPSDSKTYFVIEIEKDKSSK